MNREVFMDPFRFFSTLTLAWGLLLPLVWAQSPPPSAQTETGPTAATGPNAADASGAQSAAWRYVSVLAQYQPYAEQALASWPEANATVQRIGGWRAYAKESQAPTTAPAPAGAKP